MATAESVPTEAAVEAAISRVLDAEREAREAVVHATQEAAAINERARAAARALAERTDRRIGAARAAFATRVSAELTAIDAQTAEQDASHELSADDLDRLDHAVAALAADLTDAVP